MSPTIKHNPHWRAQSPNLGVYGISGTPLNMGYISGYEDNPKFSEPATWAQTCLSMSRQDPVLKRSWAVLKQTLLSASWRWEPANEEDGDCVEYARFMNENFGLAGYSGVMRVSWEETLEYLTEYCTNGFRYAEEIYTIDRDEFGRSKCFLDSYSDREPTSHLRFISADQQNLDGVMQWGVNAQRVSPIPANKMILLTMGKTGSNWAGNGGLFRPCHFYFRAKQRALQLLMVGLSRFAAPTPVVKVDRSAAEAMGMVDADLNAAIDEAEAQAAAYVAHESAYLVTSPAVSFDVYGGGNSGMNTEMALSLVREADQQISTAFLAQMLELGRVGSDTGSRAVGEVHLSIFRRSALNIADKIAAVCSGPDRRAAGTAGRLIKFNYGHVPPSKLPRLVHSGLDVDALSESLAALPTLVGSNILTPDNQLEQLVRDRIGAPEMGEEVMRSSLERSASGGVLGEFMRRGQKK